MDTLNSPPAILIIVSLISAITTISINAIKSTGNKSKPSAKDSFVEYLERRVRVLEARVDELESSLHQEQNMSERRRQKLLEVSRLHNINIDSLV